MEPIFCSAWGLASKGQLGCSYHSLKSINAIKIPNLQEAYFDAACGENHTLFLTDSLEILASGSNTYGQLGIGNSS